MTNKENSVLEATATQSRTYTVNLRTLKRCAKKACNNRDPPGATPPSWDARKAHESLGLDEIVDSREVGWLA